MNKSKCISEIEDVASISSLSCKFSFAGLSKLAFTLAEVLITLGIIGIVAEMTIPTLMNNVQDQVLKTSWKKAFSEISQVTMDIKNDNGGDLIGLFADADTVATLYAAKIKTTSICRTSAGQTCMAGTYSTSDASWTSMDGIVFAVGYVDSKCNTTWGSANFGQYLCTEIYVDVNGTKKPNKEGKDLFWLGIAPNAVVIPAGGPGMINSTYSCPNGAFCSSYKYLYQ